MWLMILDERFVLKGDFQRALKNKNKVCILSPGSLIKASTHELQTMGFTHSNENSYWTQQE